MSAIGPKQTSPLAPHMSALGDKADMTVCRSPLSRSLLGVKRTCPFALHMSAFDPKETLARVFPGTGLSRYDALSRASGGGNETARFHYTVRRYSGGLAACNARTATGPNATHRRSHEPGRKPGSAGPHNCVPRGA